MVTISVMSKQRQGFSIYLQQELIERLDRIAKREHRRSRGNVIEFLLLKYFEEHPEIGVEKKDEL